eukprot:scaffold330034_cov53-Tisochrysis_lutea.AAC.1
MEQRAITITLHMGERQSLSHSNIWKSIQSPPPKICKCVQSASLILRRTATNWRNCSFSLLKARS